MTGNASQVRALREQGADINAVGRMAFTPLLWAVLTDNESAVRILLDNGADPNKHVHVPNGTEAASPALWTAAATGKTRILEMILQSGGDANQVVNGDSLLYIAVLEGKGETAEVLLRHGADINFPFPKLGPNVFDAAIMRRNYELAIWVLDHGYSGEVALARKFILKDDRLFNLQGRYKAALLEKIDQRLGAGK